jgi:hypothetical protein
LQIVAVNYQEGLWHGGFSAKKASEIDRKLYSAEQIKNAFDRTTVIEPFDVEESSDRRDARPASDEQTGLFDLIFFETNVTLYLKDQVRTIERLFNEKVKVGGYYGFEIADVESGSEMVHLLTTEIPKAFRSVGDVYDLEKAGDTPEFFVVKRISEQDVKLPLMLVNSLRHRPGVMADFNQPIYTAEYELIEEMASTPKESKLSLPGQLVSSAVPAHQLAERLTAVNQSLRSDLDALTKESMQDFESVVIGFYKEVGAWDDVAKRAALYTAMKMGLTAYVVDDKVRYQETQEIFFNSDGQFIISDRVREGMATVGRGRVFADMDDNLAKREKPFTTSMAQEIVELVMLGVISLTIITDNEIKKAYDNGRLNILPPSILGNIPVYADGSGSRYTFDQKKSKYTVDAQSHRFSHQSDGYLDLQGKSLENLCGSF